MLLSRPTLWVGIVAVLIAGALLAAVRPAPASGALASRQARSALVISEVLANSGRAPDEAAHEWVELLNRSEAPVALEGWRLEDNNDADPLPAVVVPAGAFVVIAASEQAFAGGPRPPLLATLSDGRIGNGLANSGDRVVLRDPAGEAVDGVSWGEDRSISMLTAPAAGESIARAAPEAAFQLGAPSPGAATPAVEIPQGPPPPLRISEIFSNAGRGSDDAAHEWVELFNPTDDPIALRGWRLSDNAASDVLQAGSVPAQGHAVIAGSAEAVAGFGAATPPIVIADGRIGNGLANGGDVVTLQDPAGRTVDSVDYRAPPLPLPEAGRSIALTGTGWVLNTAPSPGRDEVEPLLANIAVDRASGDDAVPTAIVDEEGSGVPAWALVAIALGTPLAALAAHAAWRRRRTRARG